MVFDRHRRRELLLLDAGPLCHLWDVDVVFDTDGHMYLALTILAIYGTIDTEVPSNPLVPG